MRIARILHSAGNLGTLYTVLKARALSLSAIRQLAEAEVEQSAPWVKLYIFFKNHVWALSLVGRAPHLQ